MTFNTSIDFSQTITSLVLANTPLFLVRKLVKDPAVQKLFHEVGPEIILSQLKTAVEKEPQDISEKAIIYASLIALSFSKDIKFLLAASKLSAPHLDWFEYIAVELLARYKSTAVHVLDASFGHTLNNQGSRSSTPSTRLIIS